MGESGGGRRGVTAVRNRMVNLGETGVRGALLTGCCGVLNLDGEGILKEPEEMLASR